jgi:hypothetical protein
LASLSREAERPARFAASTLLLTVLKSGDAFGVLLAGSVLTWALLLDAIDGISNCNCCGFFKLVDAVILDDASKIV